MSWKSKQIRPVLCAKCFDVRAGRAGAKHDDAIVLEVTQTQVM
jgi:hypothetical protein